MILDILSEIKNYIDMMNEPLYYTPGWFTEDDEKLINERGFHIDISSFYDGKILKVHGNNIWTHSTKCQCSHIIGFLNKKGSLLSNYRLFFSEVESNRQWSSDPVYDIIKRDDLPSENWVIRSEFNNDSVGLLEEQMDINDDIVMIFKILKEYINERYPFLRLRIITDFSNNVDEE